MYPFVLSTDTTLKLKLSTFSTHLKFGILQNHRPLIRYQQPTTDPPAVSPPTHRLTNRSSTDPPTTDSPTNDHLPPTYRPN